MESIKKKLDNFTIILISSLPFALAAGPAVIEVFTFIIICNFLILRKKISFEIKELYIFLFYFIAIISSLLSEYKIHSLKASFFLIRIILLYYIFKHYFEFDGKKIIDLTFKLLTITLIILMFDVFFQFFFKFSFFGTSLQATNRMSMHFRDESIIGGYLSKILPIYIFIWVVKFKDSSLKLNISFFIIILLTIISTFLTNERSAIFFLVIFLFMIILFSNIRNLNKLFFLSLLVVTSITIVLTVPSIKDRIINQTIMELTGQNDRYFKKESNASLDENRLVSDKTIQYFKEKKNNNIFIFSTAHDAHIRTALNIFINEFFLGVGPNNFRNFCTEEKYGVYAERGCNTHPHHILSQVLSEVGIVGFIFYFILIIYMIKILLRQLIHKDLNYSQIFIFCFYLLLFSPIMPSGNIFNNWYLYSISLPILYIKFYK